MNLESVKRLVLYITFQILLKITDFRPAKDPINVPPDRLIKSFVSRKEKKKTQKSLKRTKTRVTEIVKTYCH